MNFAEKLKELRKRKGLSQEQLAEEIGVSRQAITKWETGSGLPDIENIKILAELFKMTIDNLILEGTEVDAEESHPYESETVYDIDMNKHFDIHADGVKEIQVISGKDEKLHIKMVSDSIASLEQVYKIKLEENRSKLDILINKKPELSEKQAKEEVKILVMLPEKYSRHCEIEGTAQVINVNNLTLDCLEFDGRADRIYAKNFKGSLEFNTLSDTEVFAEKMNGRIELYLIKATALLHITEKDSFRTVVKGRKNKVYYLKQNQPCEPFDSASSDNEICLRGSQAELTIDLI